MITSLQNQRVKNTIKLRNRRDRQKQQRFVIDGTREIAHALAGKTEIEVVFVCRSIMKANADGILDFLPPTTEVLETNESVWEKLTFGNRNDGILAVAAISDCCLDSLSEKISINENVASLIVVLDQIEKPGNIGAVIRTADGAGASAVIVTDSTGDLFNPNLIRASIGTVFRMPVVACSAKEAISWLRHAGITAMVTRVDAETIYSNLDLTGPIAIVMGSEANGVGKEWYDPEFRAIRLPMNGMADSLNVSTSAAIVLYEAVRQRFGQ